MRFEITHRIHFGYMREPGVYNDLTEADVRNLSAPRPGLPNGYGRHLPTPSVMSADLRRDIVDQAVTAGAAVVATASESREDSVDDTAAPTEEASVEEVPSTRPDDPPLGPLDPDPSLTCRGCDHKPFKSEAARNAHERQQHGRVLG